MVSILPALLVFRITTGTVATMLRLPAGIWSWKLCKSCHNFQLQKHFFIHLPLTFPRILMSMAIYVTALTHWGRVTHYGDGSMLCKKPIFFHYERIRSNLRCCDFRIHCKNCAFLHFDSSWGGGGSLWRKKKSLLQRLWGENGYNSINIRASALKLLSFEREQNFG